jgi:DNA-binding HxlR family transcriptional regulator
MSVGHPSSEPVGPEESATSLSVAEILRLFSGGASGAILLALGEGAMQTKVLTHRVRGYTARTVYRYLPRLATLGAVERDDRPGGQGRVIHTLSKDGGGELCELLNRYACASMAQLPDGQVDPGAWAALGLLADFWEAGVVEELSQGPRSQAELARRCEPLSYHQLSRRAARFRASGFFGELRSANRQAGRYVLTDTARRTMAVIAGLSRWRRRHLGAGGLTAAEMATVLRVALPLATAPDHVGKLLQARVVDDAGGAGVAVCATVAEGGVLRVEKNLTSPVDAAVEGTVADWSNLMVDGEFDVEMRGDRGLVGECLDSLHCELWEPGRGHRIAPDA